MELPLPGMAHILVAAEGLGDFFASDYTFGAALVIGGLLIGAYGQAGRMPPITAVGIACVFAGAIEQFTNVAGQGEGISRNGANALIFILAVLAGTVLLGLGLRREQSAVNGIALVLGIALLSICAVSLLLAILQISGPLGTYD